MTAQTLQPCPDGFHWVGQSFACCDLCGLPAWRHAGMSELVNDIPIGSGQPQRRLRPWEPGEAEAVQRKWARSA